MGVLMVRKEVKRRTSLLMGISLAILLGGAAAFLIFALPQHMLERLTTFSRLSRLMVQAEPPISQNDRSLLAVLAGIGTAGLGWVLIDWLLFGRVGMSAIIRQREDDYEDEDESYRPSDPLDLVKHVPRTVIETGPPANLGDPRRPLSARTDIGDPPKPGSAARWPGSDSYGIVPDRRLPSIDQLFPDIEPSVGNAPVPQPAAAVSPDQLGLSLPISPRSEAGFPPPPNFPPMASPPPLILPLASAPPQPASPLADLPGWVPPPQPPIQSQSGAAIRQPAGTPVAPATTVALPIPAPPFDTQFAAPEFTSPPASPPFVRAPFPHPFDGPPPHLIQPSVEPVVPQMPPPDPTPQRPIAEDAAPLSLDSASLGDLLARLEHGMRKRRPTTPPPVREIQTQLAAFEAPQRAQPTGFAASVRPPVEPVVPPPPPPSFAAPSVPPLRRVEPEPFSVPVSQGGQDGRPELTPPPASKPTFSGGDALLEQPLHVALDVLRNLIRR